MAKSAKKQGGKPVRLPLEWTKCDVTAAVLEALQGRGFIPDDVSAIVDASIDPVGFYHPEVFRRAYWRCEMFRKYPFAIEGVDREANAMSAFRQAEQQCARSNERLHDVFNRSSVPERVLDVLRDARKFLARLFDGFTVDEIAAHARWGPGSTTSLPARYSTASNKWWYCHHITQAALPYLDAFIGYSGWSLIQDPVVVMGNKVVTVPKNSKTDRTIAIEPDWNMFFQLGLGGAIRQRLQRREKHLLPFAQEIQQSLARRGSLDGFLATIDLAMASDTISMALVEELLPQNVLVHVQNLRSNFGSVDDGKTWFPYEKVSSMGNGFTFELETAVITAICHAAAGHATTYGDDIVVPSASAGWVTTVLEWCGLFTNPKKSHTTGPFRESCGKHYFNGVDVSPVYIDEPLIGVTRLAKANLLIAAMEHQALPELESAVSAISNGVPRLFRGPKDVTGVLHAPFDRVRPSWDLRRQTHTGKRLVMEHRPETTIQLGGLRAALFGRLPGNFSKERAPRNPRVVVRNWYSGWYRPVPPDGLRTLAPLVPRWKGGGPVSI